MSKKNGGKKKRTAGTHAVRLREMLERMAAHRVIHGKKKHPRPKPKPKE